jgi:Virulence-associated protein E
MMARAPEFEGNPLDNNAIRDLRAEITKAFNTNIPTQDVEHAAGIVADQNPYDPVGEFLQSTKWDGTKRLDRLFIDYFKAIDPDGILAQEHEYDKRSTMSYLVYAARVLMLSAVARWDFPINQDAPVVCEDIVIMEGSQGIGKSKGLKLLCNDIGFHDGFTRDLTSGSRDIAITLRSCWIVELAELTAVRKSESDGLKQFLSKEKEVYRHMRANEDSHENRQCVFVGTTNQEHYLGDATGNRRFVPLLIEIVDMEALERDRGQLWAEALEMYRTGELWYINITAKKDPLVQVIINEQEKRMLPPECLEAVKSVVSGINFLTIKELKKLLAKTGVFSKDWELQTALRIAGYEQASPRINGVRTRGWEYKGTYSRLEKVRGDASRNSPRATVTNFPNVLPVHAVEEPGIATEWANASTHGVLLQQIRNLSNYLSDDHYKSLEEIEDVWSLVADDKVANRSSLLNTLKCLVDKKVAKMDSNYNFMLAKAA